MLAYYIQIGHFYFVILGHFYVGITKTIKKTWNKKIKSYYVFHCQGRKDNGGYLT